jgi:hypothetical protein
MKNYRTLVGSINIILKVNPSGPVIVTVPVATVGSVVALAVGAVGAVGCALIVTDVTEDNNALSI